MHATALQQPSIAIHSQRCAVEPPHVDQLASNFLELQRKASDAYREAYLLDVPHEDSKEQLIGFVQDQGELSPDGSKALRGEQFEIIVRLAPSSFFDSASVSAFRYALIHSGIATGFLREIFSCRWSFTESASRLVSKFQLPDELSRLYGQCVRTVHAPILETRAIVR